MISLWGGVDKRFLNRERGNNRTTNLPPGVKSRFTKKPEHFYMDFVENFVRVDNKQIIHIHRKHVMSIKLNDKKNDLSQTPYIINSMLNNYDRRVPWNLFD